jgi:hypothetical protein
MFESKNKNICHREHRDHREIGAISTSRGLAHDVYSNAHPSILAAVFSVISVPSVANCFFHIVQHMKFIAAFPDSAALHPGYGAGENHV